MKNNAIAIANYFVDKANADKEAPYSLTLLRLVKYVYIAYGFALAVLDKIIIDERFDKVEAWEYGPVIPSVYHSFKHNLNNPIKDKAGVIAYLNKDGEVEFDTPEITDDEIKEVLDFVWERYRMASTPALIDILHHEGSPWAYCYRVGQNEEIPHYVTELYYKNMIKNAKERNGEQN